MNNAKTKPMTLDTTTLRGITESLPADEFITYTELGIIPVSFEPWDKHTDNWADESDNFCFFGKMPIR
ncbi:hypothetical protein QE197_25405 (plasmid) [Arsenophonus nasoniae]|uniref:Uncharacterized protein n=2 Tax=Arsenophonus nasoniae TaxID=638 RepID=A0ABY8NW85_9GAMM|nr:hypothetical protein [Arsenophonus nasoniae]WGM07006.1 hypothetical protein QE258_06990 [Arsenophonus nasoniae]WGM08211.1 hypothetical protein QE258_22425 [Arsenophonus nasoniae]WGM12861.1 hypothetical protein QE197_20915 [Arsenophonus nasoniae]WGM13089.1 hypothetical protein QE197_21025 [Arsenophonus nasoniae]WGM13155.1 hypothetical protein QE197_21390 [Arsenophonus nasoniae]